MQNSDLAFITNEPNQNLRKRFKVGHIAESVAYTMGPREVILSEYFNS